MKAQRLLILFGAFFLFGTGVAAGASMWGDYDGHPRARLFVNDTEKTFADSDVPAFIMNGSTVLPLRALADSLQAVVHWDDSTKTVSLYKPNVHMFVVHEMTNDYTLKQPFGKVNQGDTLDFVVFAQVDNLKANVESVKISIKTPSGDNAVTPIEQAVNQPSDSFWLPWQFKQVSFSEYGKYTVQFSIKTTDDSDYHVVSEKQILSE